MRQHHKRTSTLAILLALGSESRLAYTAADEGGPRAGRRRMRRRRPVALAPSQPAFRLGLPYALLRERRNDEAEAFAGETLAMLPPEGAPASARCSPSDRFAMFP